MSLAVVSLGLVGGGAPASSQVVAYTPSVIGHAVHLTPDHGDSERAQLVPRPTIAAELVPSGASGVPAPELAPDGTHALSLRPRPYIADED